ncbi:UNVERIFIED_CONTAM: hypothetical protein FKN15_075185 [Acipenser sinensis]
MNISQRPWVFSLVATLCFTLVRLNECVTRIYYIGIKEESWNYAPSGKNIIKGLSIDEDKQASVFLQQGPHRIGSVYKKAVYWEYRDGSYTEEIPKPEWLGFLGPVLKAEVEDVIVVHLKNFASRPYSLHPHGVFYEKDSEGALYPDGTSGKQKKDDSVPPGGSHTYTWIVKQQFAPTEDDPNCLTWAYHSHRDEPKDMASGLIGALLTCKKGVLQGQSQDRTDVDKDFILMFSVVDENLSWYLDENIEAHCTNPYTVDRDEEEFQESNKMHAINGFLFGNLPGLEMCANKKVSWHMFGMGNEVDIHSAYFHGHTVLDRGHRSDVISLFPATFVTSEMITENVGKWMLSCQVNDHIQAGMQALYQVSECNAGVHKTPSTGKERKYYIAAESVLWNYGPLGYSTYDGLALNLTGSTASVAGMQALYQVSECNAGVHKTPSTGKERKYYIAAESVLWNYGPLDYSIYDGLALNLTGSKSETFFGKSGGRIGGEYMKVVYVEYTDKTFATKKERTRNEKHLGILGPVIKAEVGDTILVTFMNKGDKNLSIQPHGVQYSKGSEGTNYVDGPVIKAEVGDTILVTFMNKGDKNLSIQPHGVQYSKGSEGTNYVDAVDPVQDTNSGLVGPLLVCRKDALNEKGLQRGVDKEFYLLFTVFDENLSWYLESNIERFVAEPSSIDQMDEDFQESNKMHAINGYMFGNMPGLDMCKGDNVSWHLMGLGNEVDIHGVYFQGNTIQRGGMTRDTLSLFPHTSVTAAMQPDTAGKFEISCRTSDHYLGGMKGFYSVQDCGNRTVPHQLFGSLRTYYIAAEELEWDYSPDRSWELQLHNASMEDRGHRSDVISLFPATFVTSEMITENVGKWMLSCQVNDHIQAGMQALYQVSECNAGVHKTPSTGKERKYYIAAESVLWNYGPLGYSTYDGLALNLTGSKSETFFGKSGGRIGGEYMKVVYVEYTDKTFATKKERTRNEKHLGILGPVIKAEVGDTILVTFMNKGDKNLSIQPHGVQYSKGSEGTNYIDGFEKPGSHVQPNESFTYRWTVTEGPSQSDPDCLSYLYYSAVDPVQDTNSGLVGPLLVCRKDALNEKGLQRGVDKEFYLLFTVFDENLSWYLESNIERFVAEPSSIDQMDEDFQESNKMHAINGYMFGNMPGLDMCKGDNVSWHLMGLGNEVDIHGVYFQGNTIQRGGMTRDTLSLFPHTSVTAAMQPDTAGKFEISCRTSDHYLGGMKGFYSVQDCGNRTVPHQLFGSLRTYYIAAEELEWDYSPDRSWELQLHNASMEESYGHTFVGKGEDLIGSKYRKVAYREYTNSQFTELKKRSPQEEHLEILGTQISCFSPSSFSWRQAAFVDSFCWAAVQKHHLSQNDSERVPLWLHKFFPYILLLVAILMYIPSLFWRFTAAPHLYSDLAFIMEELDRSYNRSIKLAKSFTSNGKLDSAAGDTRTSLWDLTEGCFRYPLVEQYLKTKKSTKNLIIKYLICRIVTFIILLFACIYLGYYINLASITDEFKCSIRTGILKNQTDIPQFFQCKLIAVGVFQLLSYVNLIVYTLLAPVVIYTILVPIRQSSDFLKAYQILPAFGVLEFSSRFYDDLSLYLLFLEENLSELKSYKCLKVLEHLQVNGEEGFDAMCLLRNLGQVKTDTVDGKLLQHNKTEVEPRNSATELKAPHLYSDLAFIMEELDRSYNRSIKLAKSVASNGKLDSAAGDTRTSLWDLTEGCFRYPLVEQYLKTKKSTKNLIIKYLICRIVTFIILLFACIYLGYYINLASITDEFKCSIRTGILKNQTDIPQFFQCKLIAVGVFQLLSYVNLIVYTLLAPVVIYTILVPIRQSSDFLKAYQILPTFGVLEFSSRFYDDLSLYLLFLEENLSELKSYKCLKVLEHLQVNGEEGFDAMCLLRNLGQVKTDTVDGKLLQHNKTEVEPRNSATELKGLQILGTISSPGLALTPSKLPIISNKLLSSLQK